MPLKRAATPTTGTKIRPLLDELPVALVESENELARIQTPRD
jgi:hypothetical protein